MTTKAEERGDAASCDCAQGACTCGAGGRAGKASRRRTAFRGKKWSELTPVQKAAVLTLGSVQISLAATAWRDLAKRPAELVNGPKAVWAVVIGVNFFGPIAYLTVGRRKA